nr:MAG: hypothetical protein DIU80_08215 [Chloroflexota bacterium]
MQIAGERAGGLESAGGSEPNSGVAARRNGIDGPTVARLVARAIRSGSPLTPVAATPTPRWVAPLREQLVRTNRSVRRAIGRADTLSPNDTDALIGDISELVQNLTDLLAHLQGSELPDEKQGETS